jgi:phospholipid/cholesterol/gamma-HCH transport system substrate-binding protein
METRANYVIVGIFTILSILAAFAFVYWTAAIGDRGETTTLRVRIPGSASGLGRGSAVLFNGVKVGDVTRVFIDVENPNAAIADTVIDRLTPITKSTEADIGLAGLTGQANIELKGGKLSEANLLDEAEREGRVAEIVADPSAVTNLLQTAQDIFQRADAVLSELEGFANDVRGPLTETVKNTKVFSDALATNAPGIDKFLESVSALSEELAGVSGKVEGTLNAAEGLLKAVDRDKITAIVANVETFTRSLSASSDQFDEIIASVNNAATSIGELGRDAGTTLAKVDGILEGVDAATVRKTMSNIQSASVNANKAAADVAKVTEKFGARGDDIDQIITDAKQLASRLNAASVRVDGILVKVDKLLGSGEAEGVIAEAGETLKAFRQVADTLNAHIGGIAEGLERFTGQGLRDVEALVRDSRRSITRIEEAVTDLERNPQRIITGGDGTVREYDGRARR